MRAIKPIIEARLEVSTSPGHLQEKQILTQREALKKRIKEAKTDMEKIRLRNQLKRLK